MRLGSLCSGIGGLDLAVEHHFGAELTWCSEIDQHASRVLAERFEGVPNLGDFRKQEPEPVDILCAGFPCQPVSSAGKRKGTNDDRWLFDDIADLVGRMDPRPTVLVFENVRGLLSAQGGHAFRRVLYALADLGYVGSWRIVRASDIGAPHQRARWFCVATDADELGRVGRSQCDQSDLARAHGDEAEWCQSLDISARGVAAPADAEGAERRATQHELLASSDGSTAKSRERDRASLADADSSLGRSTRRAGEAVRESEPLERSGRRNRLDFGPFTPAVERWEQLLGRPAPAPAVGKSLNPAFVEWMMGYPEGWVTDLIDKRTHSLRMLGNAVVPQQAACALQLLTQ